MAAVNLINYPIHCGPDIGIWAIAKAAGIEYPGPHRPDGRPPMQNVTNRCKGSAHVYRPAVKTTLTAPKRGLSRLYTDKEIHFNKLTFPLQKKTSRIQQAVGVGKARYE